MVDQASNLRKIIKTEKGLRTNQNIKITVDDEKNNVTQFESKIKAVYDNSIIISMPYSNNYFFPLENVSFIKVNINDPCNLYFTAKILDRKLTPVPVLVISRPDNFKTNEIPEGKPCRLIAITSGKGGVGKTSFSVNLAIALSLLNKEVLIFDADIGLANVDVILGLKPKYNLIDIIKHNMRLEDIIYDGPEGIKLIASGSGSEDIYTLKDREFNKLIEELYNLEDMADIIILDTGAGISRKVTNFLFAADEIIFISTPEPTSITDTYALIKIIVNNDKYKKIKLVVNKADNKKEAIETAKKLQLVCEKFLKIKLMVLGYIVEDKKIPKSIKEQKALMLEYPNSLAAAGIMKIANKVINDELWTEEDNYLSLSRFIGRFKSFFG
ncbi:MAG TPA: AAA family ATPase [Thermoanaerobacterales bacterium]|nr:AAA family ATPase [Thermoanaerobacterales bacterium]